jgi:flagellar hook-length control protein FliK
MEIGVFELPASVAHPAQETAPQLGAEGSFGAILKAAHVVANAGAQTAGGAANAAPAIAEMPPAAVPLGFAADARPRPPGDAPAVPRPAVAGLAVAVAEARPAPPGDAPAVPRPAVAGLPVAVAEAGPSRAAPIAGSPTPAAPAARPTAASAATPASAAEPAIPARPTVPDATAAAHTAAPEASPPPLAPARPDPASHAIDEPLAAAAVAVPTVSAAVAATTPAPGEVPEEAVSVLAAPPQAAAATQAPATNSTPRPAQRHGAPAGGSAQPGAGAQAQAAPAVGDGPEAPANDQASPVREAALAVARDRLAPGHAARGGESAPDFTAFRETLASVLPDNASSGPAEGARATPPPAPPALAARGPTAPPVPITDQVAVHIRQAAADGDSVVRIRLQPRELGRIDVRLEIAEGGRLSAVVTAERPDTLELLTREARGLEKALAEAGLDVDSDSLAFDLGERGESDGDGEACGAPASDDAVEAELVLPAAAIAPAATGIDIRV